MPERADFSTVFSKLKAILQPYASKLVVIADTDDGYSLETRHIMKNKKPLYFGGVRKGKNYVSFYLMSVYATPDLERTVAELQGSLGVRAAPAAPGGRGR